MKRAYGIHDEILSQEQFKKLSIFIRNHVGIQMPETKKIMLESRLRKRLKLLGILTFSEYLNYLFSPKGMEDELIQMINVITTNRTEFFRESMQFDFLMKNALPQLITRSGAGIKRRLMVWSAGCSTGEEAYTLGMLLMEFRKKYPGLNFDFFILATDISTRVLEIGKRGIYNENNIESIPMELRKEYLLKSKDRKQRLVRFIPKLREKIKFRRLNFLEGSFGFREQMDIIFFRNVLIYFDKSNQKKILTKIFHVLQPGGYLFMGHSETLLELNFPLKQAAPTIYQKHEDVLLKSEKVYQAEKTGAP